MSADTEQDPWIYFVHGSSAHLWSATSIIDSERGIGDFGAGFYVFEDTNWGRQSAAAWARRKALRSDATPILVRVKIRRSMLASLDREDVQDEDLATAYNRWHPDGRTGKHLVVGPVGRRGLVSGRTPDRRLPRQFKFEGHGVLLLMLEEIIVL